MVSITKKYGKITLKIIHGYDGYCIENGKLFFAARHPRLTTKMIFFMNNAECLSWLERWYILRKFGFAHDGLNIIWASRCDLAKFPKNKRWCSIPDGANLFVWLNDAKMIDGEYIYDFAVAKPKLCVMQESSLFEKVDSLTKDFVLEKTFLKFRQCINCIIAVFFTGWNED